MWSEQFEDDAESGMRLQLSKKNPSGYMGILKKLLWNLHPQILMK